jgi:hypothetical protein
MKSKKEVTTRSALNRRELLARTAIIGAGLAIGTKAWGATQEERTGSTERKTRRLGSRPLPPIAVLKGLSVMALLAAAVVLTPASAQQPSVAKAVSPKVWFVTGSNRGIGLGIAQAALQAGDRVVATARRPERARVALLGYGDNLFVVALDITRGDQIEAAVKAAKEKFGHIDVLVNVAGYGQLGWFENTTELASSAKVSDF